MSVNSSTSILNSNALGNSTTVADSTALAALELPAMTVQPGTRIFNQDVGSYFVYTISTEALDPDVVVAVAGTDGARWILDTSGSGVQELVAGSGITIDATDPEAPIVSASGSVSSAPLFQLALSYGQGAAGSGDLDAGDSFWFQPQSVNGTPEADQVHEWPVSRDLVFISLTVFVDTATIVLAGDAPRFIVTVDGVDTIYQATLGAGAHTDELLEANGFVSILAGSRIGVRFDGSGLDAASTLRCEMILDGAETGEPIPPPPIPTSGLLLDLASENYQIVDLGGGNAEGDWTDDSSNNNDFSTGGTLLSHVPTIVPEQFNDDAGVNFTRLNSFSLTKVSPTFYAANAARTMAMVIKGNSISPGTLFHIRASTVASHDYQLSGSGSPQIIWINNGGNIQATSPFFDLNGQKAVLMWWTNGGIGDPLFFTVNGVAAVTDATMLSEGTISYLELGYDGGVYPESLRADCSFGRALTWNRVLTVSERIGVLSNLTARYL